MNKIVVGLLFSLISVPLFSQISNVSSGTLVHYEDFASDYVQSRNVDVWLPDNYGLDKEYAVLYMHDGQMLFDSITTWNKQEWGVDETLGQLISEKKIRDCIVVAVSNIAEVRYTDYFPQKAVNYLSAADRDSLLNENVYKLNADNYLKFLVTELKPFIDQNYSTKIDADNTFVMGSSMGGLISLYALCEYPAVFGGAACLSIHSPMILLKDSRDKFNDIVPFAFRKYLEANLPKTNTKFIYMDYGDQTLDAYYAPFQERIDELMQNKGWESPYWETLFFPGTEHSERSWSQRLSIPLQFLMGEK